MSDAELVAAYVNGGKVDHLGVPQPRLYAALDRAGVPRREPRKARRRPAWWGEVPEMRRLGISFAAIGRCFSVTGGAVEHAAKRMGQAARAQGAGIEGL